jgi:solute carrier family 8 (sodium/calcium exchanger)
MHANHKDFIKLKGTRGQIDHSAGTDNLKETNDAVGFKCLHYSVTESTGHVELTIVKKQPNTEVSFGVRTIDDTATQPKDYGAIDEVVTIPKKQNEIKVKVPIVDDDEWEPDLDFFVELYDPKNGEKLFGDDTKCKVTILDEDFPGILGFEVTEMKVSKKQGKVSVTVVRRDGSDGTIQCTFET